MNSIKSVKAERDPRPAMSGSQPSAAMQLAAFTPYSYDNAQSSDGGASLNHSQYVISIPLFGTSAQF